MRSAYEKGFNTITLTDMCATTSAEGQAGATEGGGRRGCLDARRGGSFVHTTSSTRVEGRHPKTGTFGMFSAPMTGAEFVEKL